MRPEETPSIIGRPITLGGRQLTYGQLTALQKRDYLFDQGIRATAYQTGELPNVTGGVLHFAEEALRTYTHHTLSKTLTRVSDELEEPHLKLFHTYGATARIKFIPEAGTAYTGIFAEEACGLGRFSYAGPVSGVGVVPAVGLKFLVDGDHPSENMVAMRMLDSQQARLPLAHPHHSVFQNPFTNILPASSPANVVMRIVRDRFETVVQTGTGLNQPVDNLAAVRTNGESVAQDKVVAPYRLILNPTQKARAASDPSIDFRDDLAQNIVSGMRIYDVLALDEAQEKMLNGQGISAVEDLLPHGRKIGGIVTESEFIASAYGDYRLFFKHNTKYIREEFKAKSAGQP